MPLFIRENVPETYNVPKPKEVVSKEQTQSINAEDRLRMLIEGHEPKNIDSYKSPSDLHAHDQHSMDSQLGYDYSSHFPDNSKPRTFGKNAVRI